MAKEKENIAETVLTRIRPLFVEITDRLDQLEYLLNESLEELSERRFAREYSETE